MAVSWVLRPLARGGGPRTLLLCAHANGMCKEMWQPLLDGLSPLLGGADLAVDALCLDLPGQGDSQPAPPMPFDMETYGSAVLGALDEHLATGAPAPARVVGLGHSVGATSLLYAEELRPRTFSSLMLIEPILLEPGTDGRFQRFEDSPLAAMTLKRKAWFASREDAFRNWQGKGAFKLWRPEILQLFTETGLRPAKGGGFELKCPPEVEAEVYRVEISMTERLGTIGCPTSIMNTSTLPGLVPAERALRNFRKLGNPGDCVLLPGCSHFLPMEIPKQAARHVAHHLAAYGGKSGSRL